MQGEHAYSEDEEGRFHVTDQMKQDFQEVGFILVRGVLRAAEVSRLRACIEGSSDVEDTTYGRGDGGGRRTKLSLWNYAGNDVTGVVARAQKVAGTVQALLNAEPYHYHAKLVAKEAHTGGAFVWHQDYGYWYYNGCMYPDMMSVFVPLDKCTKANGCLQILVGSHKLGRVDHVHIEEQKQAELTRVEEAKKLFPLLHVEMSPGDMLFFHGNILHTSAPNTSDYRRWAYIVSYNTKHNNPTVIHHHAQYHPLHMVENSEIMSAPMESSIDKKYMKLGEDISLLEKTVEHLK